MMKLIGLNYTIQHKKGKENAVADALSRIVNEEGITLAITAPIPIWVQEIVESYKRDPHCKKMMGELALHQNTQGDYSYGNGNELLRYKGKLYIGKTSPVRKRILDQMHNSALGGHSGIQNTYRRVEQYFYWPELWRSKLRSG